MTLKAKLMIGFLACTSLVAMAQSRATTPFEQYPVPQSSLTEMRYAKQQTRFQLWAPTAERVELRLYREALGGSPVKKVAMRREKDGTWQTTVAGDLDGTYYTFNVRVGKRWLGENPGIFAQAVGTNGLRAAVVDLRSTDPEGWSNDRAPRQQDIVVYEMHHRDFSISPTSGIQHKGKFLALTERGTRSPEGLATGIDHLKELGVTHVHILPSYDYGSVDETRLSEPQYNWGYDPVNYNVPEGSYSTDPAAPKARIREFKEMVQALHANGLKVVLDVVYNHTYDLASSNFERTVPGYFYRWKKDGKPADASACGNETASEREVMRRFMIESVEYWMNEYHVDGFRFDLMGIHDVETMRQIRAAAERINPEVLIYGEGWAASAPQLPEGEAAMKAEVHRMPGIAAFSDELRDGLRGPFSNDKQAAFLAGETGHKESIMMGIVGGIAHPQLDYAKVNYTKRPWAAQPRQLMAYVSCHDDMCLNDRLTNSIPAAKDPEVLMRLNLMAQTAVFTSQGIPFMQAGEEVMRTKQMVHNSYKSPDSINQIDWSKKAGASRFVYDYYRSLIALRRDHPAFRLGDAELVRKYLEFLPSPETMVAYRLKGHAGGDSWEDIVVVLNGADTPAQLALPAYDYRIWNGSSPHFWQEMQALGHAAHAPVKGMVTVPARTAVILYAE